MANALPAVNVIDMRYLWMSCAVLLCMSCAPRTKISDYRLTITSETATATCSGWVEAAGVRTPVSRQALPWTWRSEVGPVAADLLADDPAAPLQAELVTRIQGSNGWPLTLPRSATRVLVIERRPDDGATGLLLEIGK